MATRKTKSTSSPQKDAAGSGTGQTSRMKRMSQDASTIVRDAAALLDEEVAAGILAAKQVQERLKKERRIDPKDFDGALQKFNADAHEMLTLVGDQLGQLGSAENADLAHRLLGKTHDVLDLTIEMINIGAELANQLVLSKAKPPVSRRAKSGQ
jgi:hypothetical protein